MARVWTDEQREAQRKRFEEVRAKRKQKTATEAIQPEVEELPKVETKPAEVAQDQDVNDLKRQIEEMRQTMDLLRQATLNRGQSNITMDRHGELVGEFEKYAMDPENYPDPTPRLAKEPRLAPLAFDYNYELEYSVGVSAYQTKTGKNIREPKFHITLNRIVLDDTGAQTDKRYIARKLIFHEDPEAALVIAREQGVAVDKSDERLFLNEMRYLRVRDWLFSIFWPKPSQDETKIREEVIGGSLVQVFTRNSEQPSGIPFNQLDAQKKVRA